MYTKLLFIAFVVFIQSKVTSAQRQWISPTTTAAEMRNPYTWYWPYAIAASEAYRDYFVNAQKISNQLYQQAYATQAFPWAANQAAGQAGQAGQAAWQAGQNANPNNPNWNPGWNGGGQGGQDWNNSNNNNPGFLESRSMSMYNDY